MALQLFGLRKYNIDMRLATSIFLLALLMASALYAAPPASLISDPTPADGSRLVAFDLIAEHSVVAPGQTAWIAARFRIEKDWHLYWRNPGETGLPPRVIFEAPEWVTIGEPKWPAPVRHESPGPLLDFIHEGEFVLLFPVEVASDAPDGVVAQISAKADWLVCRRECLFGEGENNLSLTAAGAPSRSADADRFDAWREALPVRLDEVRDPPVEIDWEGPTLVIDAPGADSITLFPYGTDDHDPMPTDILRQGTAEAARLTVAYNEGEVRGAPHIRGVVTITRSKRTTSWEFDLPGPGVSERTDE